MRTLDFYSFQMSRKSLYYASNPMDVSKLKEEYRNLKTCNFPVEYYTEKEINRKFSFSKGVRVYPKTKINGKILKENQTQLFIETGHTVHAQTVIFATGYEAQKEVKDKNAVVLSSYAIATNQIADQAQWHDNMMIWETARPYLYARKTPGNRIIIGGLDESTGYLEKRVPMILNNRDKLIKQLVNLFPELENRIWADYYWGAL